MPSSATSEVVAVQSGQDIIFTRSDNAGSVWVVSQKVGKNQRLSVEDNRVLTLHRSGAFGLVSCAERWWICRNVAREGNRGEFILPILEGTVFRESAKRRRAELRLVELSNQTRSMIDTFVGYWRNFRWNKIQHWERQFLHLGTLRP